MIATLTVTRGDRPQFFEFCKEQIASQTLKPDKAYFISYPPKGSEFDLVERIKMGYHLAKSEGIEKVFIIEDDDQYPSNYLEVLNSNLNGADFIGYEDTTYYNIRNRTWMSQTHAKRSSLFTTGFKVSALDDFIWPADHYLWLDIRMWEHARDRRKKVTLLKGNPCTGMKHGLGLCAGKSHNRILEHNDKDLSFLRSRVEDYQFTFYSKLKL
jgi:hypothetical protein